MPNLRDTPILLWFLFMLWKPRHAPAVCVLELCSGADSTWLYIVTVHFYKRSIIFCDYFSYKVWWLLMNCKVRLEKHFVITFRGSLILNLPQNFACYIITVYVLFRWYLSYKLVIFVNFFLCSIFWIVLVTTYCSPL